MQYLLTEEEYEALNKRAKLGDEAPSKAELFEFCRNAANQIPVNLGWRLEEPSPWGCIYDAKGEWYCDDCPAAELCPEPNKNWSK